MSVWNNRREYALMAQHKKEHPEIPETPGIYAWTSYDEKINKTYCYVGQAKNLSERHYHYWAVIKGLTYPEKHNEASLRAHRGQDIKDENGNVIGKDRTWKYEVIEHCGIDELNEREQYWIWDYMKRDNYISYNKEESLDRTTSNKKRINKIESDYRKFIGKLLSRLIIDVKDIQIIISSKLNKDGKPARISLDSLEQLKKFIDTITKEVKENEQKV